MQFSDLRFKPHPDSNPGHWQALHVLPSGRSISVTRWTTPNRYHYGDIDRPYEVLLGDDQLRTYQTASEIDQLLSEVTV